MTVAVVTDSTAYLPASLLTEHDIRVVPSHVIVAGQSYAEGRQISPDEVAEALRALKPVTTSKPSPGEFLDVYEQAAAAGAAAIVSVHVSAAMSATVSSAQLAAIDAPVPVIVVDSRSIGMAMGFAVESAARLAATGASRERVAQVAQEQALAASVVFYVDTLEHLRRGGRIRKGSALLGSALAIKPLLQLVDGQIESLERVRTTSRALAKLEERTAGTVEAMEAPLGVDLAVHHLDARDRAEALRDRLRERLPQARRVLVVELGAVVGTHVGPGTLAVSASPRWAPTPVIGAATL